MPTTYVKYNGYVIFENYCDFYKIYKMIMYVIENYKDENGA